MKIEKYSFGIGDRFGLQGKAQLEAIIKANKAGVSLVPVWNKSNREHKTIGTIPAAVRTEADEAIRELGWNESYYVDADHINLDTIDEFITSSDFFTLDVADFIGEKASDTDIKKFIQQNEKYIGSLKIEGIDETFTVSKDDLHKIGANYLFAIKHASAIYQHLVKNKGADNFITEVSMDEVETPQSPLELFFILSAMASENIPAQTIAPKFSGRFNKGVDYVGDVNGFKKEFEQDLLVIQKAINEFGLPDNLKLSVHSGSDKFSIYPIIGELIKKYDKGIHIKTAGTTWLEEVIGLSMAGGAALEMAKGIYSKAYTRQDELCGPYASVIDIDPQNLPAPKEVNSWDSEKFANSLRHIPEHPDYNLNFRQLIHVGYKVAAELGEEYTSMLIENKDIVAAQVTENIYDRHIKRLFQL